MTGEKYWCRRRLPPSEGRGRQHSTCLVRMMVTDKSRDWISKGERKGHQRKVDGSLQEDCFERAPADRKNLPSFNTKSTFKIKERRF